MKTNKKLLAIVSVVIVCALSLNFYGCTTVQGADLMEGITPNDVVALNELGEDNAAVTDFALRLFKAGNENGENTLISPLSVLCALAMTANGAKGETLEQMERVLGMSTDELNLYIYSYMQALPDDEKCKLSLANSIWFKDDNRFEVNPDFLQENADYYGADIYKSPFDGSTLSDINGWVKENTDGMIPEILDSIPKEAVMYLVNALAFDAEWADMYEKHQVREGTFTKEDGTEQDAEFMYSAENTYLEDENAVGFMKYYSGRKYAFVALLPNEGISLSEYLEGLDGEALNKLLCNPKYTPVNAAIPKFETEFEIEMSETLIKMGMPAAFDGNRADFTDLGIYNSGKNNIYISRVLHKTFVSVGEKGTRAGAATVVEMVKNTSISINTPKEVYLDRPFVYMLVDCENNIPFFIGVMSDIEK